MSLRKVDISELMDAYEDTEFLPEEDVSVNTDKIKQEVANIVKGKHHTGRKLILLAAALAACLALAGWAWGERVYQFISGSTLSTGGNQAAGTISVDLTDGLNEAGAPTIITLEEGRLWFVATGERIDVTDLVDEATPYVWTRWLEDGSLHYIIVGGTPEDYGWYEGIKLPDGSGGGSGMPHSRTDLSTEEQLRRPAWLEKGETQVRELWQEMKSEEK